MTDDFDEDLLPKDLRGDCPESYIKDAYEVLIDGGNIIVDDADYIVLTTSAGDKTIASFYRNQWEVGNESPLYIFKEYKSIIKTKVTKETTQEQRDARERDKQELIENIRKSKEIGHEPIQP